MTLHHVGKHARRVHLTIKECNANGAVRVVLVHGSMACKEQFDSLSNHLSENKNVSCILAWDAYGCGRSEKPNSAHEYTEEKHFTDAHDIIASSTAVKHIVVGHSFGSNLALQLAHSPGLHDKIHGLVLLGAAPTRPGTSSRWLWHLPPVLFNSLRPVIGKGFIQRAFHPATAQHIIAQSQSINADNPTHVIQAFYRSVRWNCRPILEARGAGLPRGLPILVATGDGDQLTTPEQGKAVAAALPGAEYHSVPNAGHMLMMEQPAAVAALINRVIDKVTAQAGKGQGA